MLIDDPDTVLVSEAREGEKIRAAYDHHEHPRRYYYGAYPAQMTTIMIGKGWYPVMWQKGCEYDQKGLG